MREPFKPLVGLPSDVYRKDDLMFHSIGDKYLRAVADVGGCLPVMVPSIGPSLDLESLFARLDGIVVTGATSNVHPTLFGVEPGVDYEPYDRMRDATSLNLIRAALDREMPLLCICRGFQELNVVFGGTLVTEVHTRPGHRDHRSPASDDLDVRYGPAHPVTVREGGPLETILGKREIMVNTVHRQAIGKLGKGLEVEAVAPDGVIEAVSITTARGFALGIQWHPEYRAADNPDSVKLFEALADAARAYAAGKSIG